ncbi:hypothetical protein [Piscinibacter sp. XHJ-5]|uniref:hypothetical protein n=1 Tax=Piscinibacter sp. XHJ-5 TaxID=3037797 RepID=UPI0024531023|nr:hypothetical protein [Piscinibacter sp. XHJ-5]
METTGERVASSTFAKSFALGKDRDTARDAVAQLYAHRDSKSFLSDFKVEWTRAIGERPQVVNDLASNFIHGLEQFDKPFGTLLQAVLLEAALSDPLALAQRLQDLIGVDTSAMMFMDPGFSDAVFRAASVCMETMDAPTILEALARLLVQMQRPDVRRVMELAGKAKAEVRASTFASVACALTEGECGLDQAAWTTIIAAAASRHSTDTGAASLLASALRGITKQDLVTDAALRQWIGHLLRDDNDRAVLPTMLECALGERVVQLFLPEPGTLDPWPACGGTKGVMKSLVMALYRSNPASVSTMVIQHLLDDDQWQWPHAVPELAQAMSQLRWSVETDWDNVILLATRLPGGDIVDTCAHVVEALSRRSALTKKRYETLLHLE